MTYVELIVVLSIFAIMSSVVILNYGNFETKVEIKTLSNDIAQKVVQAQKFAMSGKSVPKKQQEYMIDNGINWTPSYGVYFSQDFPKKFVYFADLNNSASNSNFAYNFNSVVNANNCSEIECLEVSDINKDYSINSIQMVFPLDSCSGASGSSSGSSSDETYTFSNVEELSVTFTRPDSRAVIQSVPVFNCSPSFAVVNLSSANNAKSIIKIYPSGRIQIN
mgnify:CR=1 FL=1